MVGQFKALLQVTWVWAVLITLCLPVSRKALYPLGAGQLTLFAAVTHLMSYLWEGAITLQVTSKGSPTIRTWSMGSIITDTGFSSATERQAGKDSTSAGLVTHVLWRLPKAWLPSPSHPLQPLYPLSSPSLGLITPFCACVYGKQYRLGRAQQSALWVEREGEPSAMVTS